jgi:hypothetical protein
MLRRALSVSVLSCVTSLFISGIVHAEEQVQNRARNETQQEAQQPIYGSHLMTEQERAEHRAQMRAAKTAEERERIRKEHHERMEIRAKERGVTIPDEPPPRGGGKGPGRMGPPSSGMGPGGAGMGPGGGMGGGMGPGGGGKR